MGRGDLQIVSAPRELQAFAVGGWEAGSSVGRALAVADWQWEFVGERCHRRSQIGEVGLRAC